MEKKKVGVIIATLGGRLERLLRSVNSVREQTYEGEIVIYLVADGPGGERVSGEIKEKVDHFIVRNERGGPGAARNSGVVAALERGCDYIHIIDDDDWAVRDFLSSLVPAIEDFDVVYGDLTIYNLEKKEDVWTPIEGGPQFSRDWGGWGSMKDQPYIPLPAALFKAEYFKKYGLFREDIGKCVDWELFARGEANGARFHHVNKIVGFAEWRWGKDSDNFCSTKAPEETFPPTSWSRIKTIVSGHYI